MTTLARLWQRHHRDKGNNRHCNDGKDACASTATTPSRQGQQSHRDDGKDACASIMTTMPLQQGQQHQLEDHNDAIATRATTPLQIKGDDAVVTKAMTPPQQRQGRLHIDNGDNTIVIKATIAIATTTKMPAHWWQQCHHNKGNDASSMASNEGNKACSTMAETPAH